MRRVLSVLAVVAVLAAVAAPAVATTNPVATGTVGPGGAGASAGDGDGGTATPVSSGGGSGGSGGPACVYVLANPSTVEILPDSPPAGPGTGGFYYGEYCDGVFEGYVYIPNSPAGPSGGPQPQQLAHRR